MSLSGIDWIVISVYIFGMMCIGFWAMRRVYDCGSYLLGKRKMGKCMMIAATFSGGTSSQHPLSVASASYQAGFSGMWISLTYMFVMPFIWLFPPVFRRARIVTMVDFVKLRYGQTMGMFYNIVSFFGGVIAIGMGVKTASVVVVVMTGGAVSEFWAQTIIIVPTLIYCISGGVIAAYASDVVQGLLIVVLSFMLIPFAANSVGGFSALHTQLPEKIFHIFGDGYSITWIAWFVVSTIFSAASWGSNAAYGGATNEMAARLSIFGGIIKRVCTIGWMLVGVFAIAVYGGKLAYPDGVFAEMCADLLPIGLRGLMVASILAAVMSSVASGMIFTVSLLINNLYKEFIVPKASPKQYLRVARFTGVLVVMLGWVIATQIQSLVHFMLILERFGGLVGVSILGCLMWRRATGSGAVASVAVMAPLFYYATMYRQDLSLTISTPLYLVPGLVAFVVVSLLTKQHDNKKVAEFYMRLDTPLGQENRLREQGVEADLLEELDGESIAISEKDHDISKHLLLLDFLTWPVKVIRGEAKLSDYRIDMIGFFGTVAFVVLFLFGVYLISRIGA